MPTKERKADAKIYDRYKREKAQRVARTKAGHANEILPGWESPPPALNMKTGPEYVNRRERKYTFQNLKRLGGFLHGEASRFLKNAESAAKKMIGKGKGRTVTTYKRSQDQVVLGKPEPETPELKPKRRLKEGYRIGKVPKVADPIAVTKLDEKKYTKPNFGSPESIHKLEYLYGHTYRNTDTKPEEGVLGTHMKDVHAYMETNPIGVAQFMHRQRMGKLKKEGKVDQYNLEKAAVIGVGAGLVAWKGYKHGKRLYKEFMKFHKGL